MVACRNRWSWRLPARRPEPARLTFTRALGRPRAFKSVWRRRPNGLHARDRRAARAVSVGAPNLSPRRPLCAR